MNNIEKSKERLFKMLSQYTNVLFAVEKDYKPFVARNTEEELSRVYLECFPGATLRDWNCPACCIHNWKLFNNFYKNYNKSK